MFQTLIQSELNFYKVTVVIVLKHVSGTCCYRPVSLCYRPLFLCWRASHSVTHKHELWIWLTLSYGMMKALLRLTAVRDTKQAGELRGDTVHFIATSSALFFMTQNGNIYRPLKQTATCLLRLYSSKHIAENS